MLTPIWIPTLALYESGEYFLSGCWLSLSLITTICTAWWVDSYQKKNNIKPKF